ncbi:MAG: alpha-amylase family glycosyl hydrolase, partial [Oscillospiraceae bacterium]|nr:alpha-amylase family glycosyl hydrolase [Oscillospiraceae bacterium]
DVRRDVYSTMRWWLDKGIDGFRMDVINLISKPQNFPGGGSWTASANGPRVHEFLREMRREVLDGYDIMTVGETPEVTVEQAIQYASLDGKELNMVFQFEHMMLDCDNGSIWTGKKAGLAELKEVLSRWQTGLSDRGWNSLYFNNHDRPRSVSRYGDDGEYREKSAKMLATCLHFMQGTPYVYQGEELGMTNAPFTRIEDCRDIETINAFHELVNREKRFTEAEMLKYIRLKSRDNSRTPMQWHSGKNAGFSDAEPWIMVNPNYTEINAEEQMSRDDSVFAYYKELIRLRKEMDVITLGSYELLLPNDPDLFVYTRRHNQEELLVACNFSRKEKALPFTERFKRAQILIANDRIGDKLKPFDAVVYYLRQI